MRQQSNFGQNLVYGGPAVVFFGLVIAFFVQGIISIGLSELASAFPVSHTTAATNFSLICHLVVRGTVSFLLYPRSRKAQEIRRVHGGMDVGPGMVDCYVSIIAHACTIGFDQIIRASGTSLAAVTVIGLAKFFHPTFDSSSWQIWLVFCAVAFVTGEDSSKANCDMHADEQPSSTPLHSAI